GYEPGLAGVRIAAILSAAIRSLSSTLNTLSTSTVSDLYQRFTRRATDDSRVLRLGKLWTLVWAAVFVGFGMLFTSTDNPIVEVGLEIASYTYGALLGAFALGLFVRRARQKDAIIAFVATLAGVAYLGFGVSFDDDEALAFPWFTPVGVLITLIVGGLLSLRHPHSDNEHEPAGAD